MELNGIEAPSQIREACANLVADLLAGLAQAQQDAEEPLTVAGNDRAQVAPKLGDLHVQHGPHGLAAALGPGRPKPPPQHQDLRRRWVHRPDVFLEEVETHVQVPSRAGGADQLA